MHPLSKSIKKAPEQISCSGANNIRGTTRIDELLRSSTLAHNVCQRTNLPTGSSHPGFRMSAPECSLTAFHVLTLSVGDVSFLSSPIVFRVNQQADNDDLIEEKKN